MSIRSGSSMHLKFPQGRPVANVKLRQIAEAIQAIDPTREGPYVVVEDYRAENSFIQAFKRAADDILIEFAEGTPRRQFRADHLSESCAIQIFGAFLKRDGSHKSLVPWKDITLDLQRELRNRKRPHRARTIVRRQTGRRPSL